MKKWEKSDQLHLHNDRKKSIEENKLQHHGHQEQRVFNSFPKKAMLPYWMYTKRIEAHNIITYFFLTISSAGRTSASPTTINQLLTFWKSIPSFIYLFSAVRPSKPTSTASCGSIISVLSPLSSNFRGVEPTTHRSMFHYIPSWNKAK